jgi:hypothetical protein
MFRFGVLGALAGAGDVEVVGKAGGGRELLVGKSPNTISSSNRVSRPKAAGLHCPPAFSRSCRRSRRSARGGTGRAWAWLRRVTGFESELALHRVAQDAVQATALVAVVGDGMSVVATDGVGEFPLVGAAVVGGLPGCGVAEDAQGLVGAAEAGDLGGELFR